MAETEEKKEAKSIEETFGELDLLAAEAGGSGYTSGRIFPSLQTGNGAS